MNMHWVVITTALGSFTVELYPDRAPITVANFLDYVRNGKYHGTCFFRIVTPHNQVDKRRHPIKVIHGGPQPLSSDNFPMIPLEPTGLTGLRHGDGAISMGRDATDSAEGDFFICIGSQPAFDEGGSRHPDGLGFATFGQVIEGMEVCRRIYGYAGPSETLKPEAQIPILSTDLLPWDVDNASS